MTEDRDTGYGVDGPNAKMLMDLEAAAMQFGYVLAEVRLERPHPIGVETFHFVKHET